MIVRLIEETKGGGKEEKSDIKQIGMTHKETHLKDGGTKQDKGKRVRKSRRGELD
jgi:hypothetical protein